MIVAGFGFRRGASADSLRDALARAGGVRAPDRLATVADKAVAPALRALASALGCPVCAIPEAALTDQTTLTASARVRAARGTGSVAEASALAAAGPDARLIGPRSVSADRMATCALAEGKTE